jgi:hypothetical protein
MASGCQSTRRRRLRSVTCRARHVSRLACPSRSSSARPTPPPAACCAGSHAPLASDAGPICERSNSYCVAHTASRPACPRSRRHGSFFSGRSQIRCTKTAHNGARVRLDPASDRPEVKRQYFCTGIEPPSRDRCSEYARGHRRSTCAAPSDPACAAAGPVGPSRANAV